MSDFLQYQLAQARREAAREKVNYASAALELVSIRCRMAELRSQHQPAADIVEMTVGDKHTLRDKLHMAVKFVVVGRMT